MANLIIFLTYTLFLELLVFFVIRCAWLSMVSFAGYVDYLATEDSYWHIDIKPFMFDNLHLWSQREILNKVNHGIS